MKSKKIISLVLIAIGIGFFSYLSGIMFLGGSAGVFIGAVFLIPVSLCIVGFLAVLFDKHHPALDGYDNEDWDGLCLG